MHRQFLQDLLPKIYFNAFYDGFIYSVFILLPWIRSPPLDSLKSKFCLPLIFSSPLRGLFPVLQPKGRPCPSLTQLALPDSCTRGMARSYLASGYLHMVLAKTEYFLTAFKHFQVCPIQKRNLPLLIPNPLVVSNPFFLSPIDQTPWKCNLPSVSASLRHNPHNPGFYSQQHIEFVPTKNAIGLITSSSRYSSEFILNFLWPEHLKMLLLSWNSLL